MNVAPEYYQVFKYRQEVERHRAMLEVAQGVLLERLEFTRSHNPTVREELFQLQEVIGWPRHPIFFDLPEYKWKFFNTPAVVSTQRKISVLLRFAEGTAVPADYFVCYTDKINGKVDQQTAINYTHAYEGPLSLRYALRYVGMTMLNA